jgi:hypothetical protein
MNISVIGLGIISKVGNNQAIEELLKTNSYIKTRDLPQVHSVVLEVPEEFDFSKQLFRRMSHFAKISFLSACYAIKDSGLDITGKSIGIIQGSVYGPIISGFRAFDDLIDFGDNQLSPTNFSGSVFNTAAAYLSIAFNIQGPTLTHTSGLDTLYSSLLTAALWLEQKEVDYVIVGVGDEYAALFDNNDSNPTTGLIPNCEGWTTFILSRDQAAKYGTIEFGKQYSSLALKTDSKIIYSVWNEQIKSDLFDNQMFTDQFCNPVYLRGSYPTGVAFDLALALLCNKNKRFPIYHSTNGDYHIVALDDQEKICCYSLAENNAVLCYQVR